MTSEEHAAATATLHRILLVVATRHGSTTEVADAVAGELRTAGTEVDVRPAADGPSPAGYDAVVVGGPMIMGWHRHAVRYVSRNRDALARVPTAFFITAMSLTETGEDEVEGVPIVKDSWLVKKPGTAGRLSRRERYARPAHYLGGVRKKAPQVRPCSVAFFAGSLDLTKMNLFEKLFVMLVIGATPGDGRHWDAIREWAATLPTVLAPRV